MRNAYLTSSDVRFRQHIAVSSVANVSFVVVPLQVNGLVLVAVKHPVWTEGNVYLNPMPSLDIDCTGVPVWLATRETDVKHVSRHYILVQGISYETTTFRIRACQYSGVHNMLGRRCPRTNILKPSSLAVVDHLPKCSLHSRIACIMQMVEYSPLPPLLFWCMQLSLAAPVTLVKMEEAAHPTMKGVTDVIARLCTRAIIVNSVSTYSVDTPLMFMTFA